MSSSTTQTVQYDNPNLNAAYNKLARSRQGLDGAPEWPLLRQMLLSKPINGKAILDLGCGHGWACRWARAEGAEQITGIDVSAKMIEKAKKLDTGEDGYRNGVKVNGVNGMKLRVPEIRYIVHDLETVHLERDSYDVVFSSLAFHYISDIQRLFQQVHQCLKADGGRFIFSIEHPIMSAPKFAPTWTKIQTNGHDHVVWPLNSYKDEGLRMKEWLGVQDVKKYHRTIETYVSMLLECGFVLTGLKEWAPSKEDLMDREGSRWVPGVEGAMDHPEWVDERGRPYFLLVSASVPPVDI